jgi:hypothetical protein
LVEHVASVGSDVRAERNKRAHEGIQRHLTDEPFFKILSLLETVRRSGKPKAKKRLTLPKDGSIPFQDVKNSEEYDLRSVYVALATKMDKEFVPLGDEMVEAVRKLTDALCDPFCERLARKGASAA